MSFSGQGRLIDTVMKLIDPLANLQTWVVIHSISLTGLNQLIDSTILRLDLDSAIHHLQSDIIRINTIYSLLHLRGKT